MSQGRQYLGADNVLGQTTSQSRHHLRADNVSGKTSSQGRQHPEADTIQGSKRSGLQVIKGIECLLASGQTMSWGRQCFRAENVWELYRGAIL